MSEAEEGNNAASNLSEMTADELLLYAAIADDEYADRYDYAVSALDAGADVDLLSVVGFTPLMYATNAGETEMVELLIANGADLNAVAQDESGTGFFPLIFAVDRDNALVVNQLLEAGANVNLTLPNGETALHRAIKNNNPAIVQELLDHGADLNAFSGELNPLMYLASLENGKDRKDITQKIQDAMRHNANLVPTSKAVNVLNENAARAAAIPTRPYYAGRPKGKMEGGRRRSRRKLKSRSRKSRRSRR